MGGFVGKVKEMAGAICERVKALTQWMTGGPPRQPPRRPRQPQQPQQPLPPRRKYCNEPSLRAFNSLPMRSESGSGWRIYCGEAPGAGGEVLRDSRMPLSSGVRVVSVVLGRGTTTTTARTLRVARAPPVLRPFP
ncbi:hypothetical protein KUF71_017866 [Frankliniella fusca]|uniref:Uncharacterized protein n=1 Tax=Frankliniella fusca TaxID=407009 RepID=A0AAE1I4S9_9NEOP|nr:hypothetical protein KUF71_017866 [Frankliniella fusca]